MARAPSIGAAASQGLRGAGRALREVSPRCST